MKNTYLLILLTIGMTYYSKAQNDRSSNPHYPLKNGIATVITGAFPDSLKTLDIMVIDFSKPDLDSLQRIEYTLNISNGKFSMNISIVNPVYVYFKQINGSFATFSAFNGIGRTVWGCAGILVEPGDSIRVDASKYSTYNEIKISGKGAEKHQCFQDILKETNVYSYPMKSLSNGDLNLEFRDSITNMVLNVVSKYEHVLSKPAIAIIKANTIPLLLFQDIPSLMVGSKKLGTKAVSGSRLNILKKAYLENYLVRIKKILDIEDSSLLYTHIYLDRTTLYPQACAEYLIDSNKNGELNDYQVIEKYFPESAIKYRVLGNYLISRLRIEGGKASFETKNAINSYVKNPKSPKVFCTAVLKRYNNSKSIKALSEAYPFELPDTTGKLIKLSDFRGKVVLIDFMFTGCPGCVEMAPKLTEIEHHFKDKEVAFVAISGEKEIRKWKQGIGSSSSKSAIQLYTNGLGFKHPVIKHYALPGYPTLILIDKKGKLVTSRAPDPRRDNGRALIAMIEKALKDM